MTSLRARRSLALAAIAAIALTGCTPHTDGAQETATPSATAGTVDPEMLSELDMLSNLGSGTRADYAKQMTEATSETDRHDILDAAKMANAVVGKRLWIAQDLDVKGQTFELRSDHTVTASNKLMAAYMSNAKYWKVGKDAFELCPDKACDYYASWVVTAQPGAAASGWKGLAPYTFTLYTNGKATEVTRKFGTASK